MKKMGTSFIEILLLTIFLAFCIQSCCDKTSMSYLFGKEFRKAQIEFERGYNQLKDGK